MNKRGLDIDIEVHGSCSSTREEMAKAFASSGPKGISELGGEFVAVVRSKDEEWIISSPGGIFPYFYTRRDGGIVHGKTVFEVMKRAGYSWSWNWSALGDLLAADYIIGGGTLHSMIERVPPGCILDLRSPGKEIRAHGTWCDSPSRKHASPSVALDIFNEEVRRNAAGRCALSLSGGLDSRAILSSLLRFGARPLLYTMGDAMSTDVRIAREISDMIGLDLEEIRLSPDDYLEDGERIVELTGGAKTARHWHTYIFAKRTGLPRDVPLFVGSNGGFARDTFMDYGMFVRFLNLPARSLQTVYWKWKTKPPFSRREISTGLTQELARELEPSTRKKGMEEMTAGSPKRLLDALQHQFYTLRLRNFIGYGLQMYSEHVAWCSPFLSKKWISEVRGLPHSWMLGSNWHRYCIHSNYPKLMEVVETNYLEPPASRAPFVYRKPRLIKGLPRVPYVDYSKWFADSAMHEYLREEIRNIDDLMDEKLATALLDEHYRRRNRTQALSWMLCMCFLKKVIAAKGA